MGTTRIPLSMVQEESQTQKDRLEMSTAEIGLSVRTTNCLEERGIFTVHDLLHLRQLQQPELSLRFSQQPRLFQRLLRVERR